MDGDGNPDQEYVGVFEDEDETNDGTDIDACTPETTARDAAQVTLDNADVSVHNLFVVRSHMTAHQGSVSAILWTFRVAMFQMLSGSKMLSGS